MGDLVAHQDPDLVEFLPLSVQFHQGADFEESCCDVETRGQVAPLAQVVEAGVLGVTVVDYVAGVVGGMMGGK